MSGDSMTANHSEHEIATFPRITGRDGQERPAMKREAGTVDLFNAQARLS